MFVNAPVVALSMRLGYKKYHYFTHILLCCSYLSLFFDSSISLLSSTGQVYAMEINRKYPK